MRTIHLFAVLAAAAYSTTEAASQTSEKPRSQYEVRKSLEALNRFSRCMAVERPDAADNALALPLESAEQAGAIRDMTKSLGERCIRVTKMRIKYPPALVGGMAEARVLAGKGVGNPSLAASAAAKARGRNPAEGFALCLVARTADSVVRLIETNPASHWEHSAAQELRAASSSCSFGSSAFAGDDFALRTYAAAGLFLAMKASSKAGDLE